MNANVYRLVFSKSLGVWVAVAETAKAAGKCAGSCVLLGALALAASPAQAQSLPTGGNVTQGAGKISVNGADMLVRQDSARMVADWQSFSIGARNSVRFVQPGSDSVALNRVLGSDPSRIFGGLSANGHVYLQNPNGVLFAPGSQVNVGSLVATSLTADMDQFKAGALRLSGGTPASGSVRNEGSITTPAGGHVVLAAPQVANTGSIATPGGTTALVAGNAVNIDPTGSGLLSITVPLAALNAQLENAGTLSADGGAVLLHAAATDAALRTVMQVGGVVRARSIEQRDGQIVLSGGSSGMVRISGTLDAAGAAAGTRGGSIKVLGERVALVGQARVDASGDAGGGTVLVGGNYQGKGPEANASDTYVGRNVTLDASARLSGDGGKVVVWSDNTTRYAGSIFATGGAQQGNGGQAEVSGKKVLNFDGQVNLKAARGKSGSLLLDPTDITIGVVADVNGDSTTGDDLATPNLLFGDFPNAASQITATRVATLLGTGDVNLQATNSIAVRAPLDVAPAGPNTTLFLNSPTVLFAQPVTLNNSSLNVTGVNITVDDALVSAASVRLSLDPSIPPGFINQTFPSGIRTNSLTIARNSNAIVNVTLDGSLNQIGNLNITADTALVRVDNAPGTPLNVRGTVGGNFTLQTNTGVVQTAPLNVSGAFDLTTTDTNPVSGAVVLTNAANSFGSLSFNVGSSLNLVAAGALRAQGSADTSIRLVSSGPFTLDISGLTSRSTTNPSNIDVSGAGFIDSSDASAPITIQPGGRFFIRSSDFSADQLGNVLFSAAGLLDLNYTIYSGWTGPDPSVGNGYYTNQTGQLGSPPTDVPPISKVYDGNTAFAFVQSGGAAQALFGSGVVPLSAYSVTSTGTFANKNVGTDKAYTVAVSNDVVATRASTGDAFYGLQYTGFSRLAGPGNALSQVTARPITSSGITGVDRVYNATTTVGLGTGGAVLNGTITGDNVNLVTSSAFGTMADKNVGNNKPVTVNGLTLGGTDAPNYSLTDVSNARVNIGALGLTSTGIVAVNRVYDATTAVALATGGATLNGTISGDNVNLVTTGALGTMANKNVGTAKPVSISGLTLSGSDSANYTVADASNATVDISARAITSSGITGVDRIYDATTAVALDTSAATLNGVIVGDGVSLATSGAFGTLSNKTVGLNKPVTVGGLTLGGTDAPNYSLVDASNATVNIAVRTLTPAGVTATNRVEDGTTLVGLNTANASVVGVLPGDTVNLDASAAVGNVATPDPGINKPVTISGLTLNGTDSVNYAMSSAPFAGGTTVRILSFAQSTFDQLRYKEYLQAVSDAQEPFRRAMAEALAAGFGKENIRKQLQRGLVFETGLAAPAVDVIDSAARPQTCTVGRDANGATLVCTP